MENVRNAIYIMFCMYPDYPTTYLLSAVTKYGKVVKFGSDTYQVLDDGNLVGVGTKFGELFYLNCCTTPPSSYATDTQA